MHAQAFPGKESGLFRESLSSQRSGVSKMNNDVEFTVLT